MIPGSFDYHSPATLAEAAALLADHGESARVVAGGHSLVPLMKLRMTAIEHLVDLRSIADLRGITRTADTLTIGAMTTQHEIVTSDAIAASAPILREAALQIADPQVRYMGTLGGNVANGDPGNDMPSLMLALDARFRLAGPDGTREIAARGFYESAYQSARRDDEILTHVIVPVPAAGTGWAYLKQKRKIGDYATAAAAVLLRREGGTIASASVAMTNLADTPRFAEAAGAALVGTRLEPAAVEAAVAAMQAAIDPSADNRGPVEFKRHVAGAMLRRAIARAAERAA
jgi:aerobic carbon-monoxide dehydrogenase medium subunit